MRIQEDLLLKHTTTTTTTELEKLKHENMLMRAHIEFSPDGRKFIEVRLQANEDLCLTFVI